MSSSRGDHFEMPWKTLEIPVYSRKFNRDKIILFVGDIKTNPHFLFSSILFESMRIIRSLVQGPVTPLGL